MVTRGNKTYWCDSIQQIICDNAPDAYRLITDEQWDDIVSDVAGAADVETQYTGADIVEGDWRNGEFAKLRAEVSKLQAEVDRLRQYEPPPPPPPVTAETVQRVKEFMRGFERYF